jgi:hypothetical protein
MLAQNYRDVLVSTATEVLLTPVPAKNFFNMVRPGAWDQFAPVNGSLRDAVAVIVDAANAQGWVRDVTHSLTITYPARPEFTRVLTEIDASEPPKTAENPFQEVLLASDRPFVNRQGLRAQLLNLTSPGGSSLLLVDGEPQTGKTFSYYLINHAAPKKGFLVNKFRMSRLPKPDDLAGEILGRMGVEKSLPAIGSESAERWAEKLAGIVAIVLREKAEPRLFVFDEFSDTALPEGTVSLIIRLVTYADEELNRLLRIVLVRFRTSLPQDLENVALRDDAKPFTDTDMIAAIMQIASARHWSVKEEVVAAKIAEFQLQPGRTLSDRFRFVRGLVQQLAGAP